jgi:uncharacterized protein YbjT (DUF2867 family)
VRRVIHFSAIGVDHATPTAFSETKRKGEQALIARELDWVILRPSVVIGRTAYGGSALLRGLAALPLFPVLPDTAAIQPVHLDDVVDSVLFFLKPGAPARVSLDVCGPDRMSFANAVVMFRTWLRWQPALHVPVPRGAAALLYAMGDLVRALGWPTPISSTARLEMRRGASGDPAPWQSMTGIVPRSLPRWLAVNPASVQDRCSPASIYSSRLSWACSGFSGWQRDLSRWGLAGSTAWP